MYGDKMSEFFKKIHVTIIEHKPGEYKKYTFLLIDIVVKWYVNKQISKPSHINSPRFRKKAQKK